MGHCFLDTQNSSGSEESPPYFIDKKCAEIFARRIFGEYFGRFSGFEQSCVQGGGQTSEAGIIYSGLVIIISQNSSKSMEPEPSSSNSSMMPSSSSSVRGARSSAMRPLRVSVVM